MDDLSKRKAAILDAAADWIEAVQTRGPEEARPFRDRFLEVLDAALRQQSIDDDARPG